MIDLEAAYAHLARMSAAFPVLETHETLATDAAQGRYLAAPLTCHFDNPRFTQSAMDGIAFGYTGHSQRLRCVATVAAGDAPDLVALTPGQCVRIMTGAALPTGADTVEMVEKVRFDGEFAQLSESVRQGQHVRPQGENARIGDELLATGTCMSPAAIAAAMSQGHRFLQLKRRLRIGIVSTGNEIIDYRRPLGPGQIYNTNGPVLASLLHANAHQISQFGSIADDPDLMRKLIQDNVEIDVFILSGGVSMGQFDHVPEAAMAAGYTQVFHKIRMKPGKPVWFGRHPSGRLLFGLPGNPISVLVGAVLFVQPTLSALLSGSFRQPCWAQAKIAVDFQNRGDLPLFIGVKLEQELDGLFARPLATSGSGDLIHFSTAQTLCRVNPGRSLKRGDTLEVLLPFGTGIS